MPEKWRCPRCGGYNPGSALNCLGCDASRDDPSLEPQHQVPAPVAPGPDGVAAFYLAHINSFIPSKLWPGEQLVATHNTGNFGYSSLEIWFGCALITTHRLVRIRFRADVQTPLLFLLQDNRPRRPYIEVTRESREPYVNEWTQLCYIVVDLPGYPLTSREASSRRLQEHPLSGLSSIESTSYPVRQGRVHELFELRLVFVPDERVSLVYYNATDADRAYSLMAESLRSRHADQPPPSIGDQLEKLTDLRRYQVITDEEYEAARNRLLKG